MGGKKRVSVNQCEFEGGKHPALKQINYVAKATSQKGNQD
jgi:hypothetical protein